MRLREGVFKKQRGRKLRGGQMKPTEGLSFQQHRLLMKLNFQSPTTSALTISQFYRYGPRMWFDENVKWDSHKIIWNGAAFYSMTINQTQTQKKKKKKIQVDLVSSIQSTTPPDLEEDRVSCCNLKKDFLSHRFLTFFAQATFECSAARVVSKGNSNNLFIEYVSIPNRFP